MADAPYEARRPWWEVLDLDPATADRATVSRHYRAYARESDGDERELLALNLARDDALAFLAAKIGAAP